MRTLVGIAITAALAYLACVLVVADFWLEPLKAVQHVIEAV